MVVVVVEVVVGGGGGAQVTGAVAVVVSAGFSLVVSGGAECLKQQWLVVAHYFTAFHCQISISETQNRLMGRKKRHSKGDESQKGLATVQLGNVGWRQIPDNKAPKDNMCRL